MPNTKSTQTTCPACASLPIKGLQCNKCRRENPSQATRNGQAIHDLMQSGVPFAQARAQVMAGQED